MLLDEARVASRVRHANVVPVLDVGECGEPIVPGDGITFTVNRSATCSTEHTIGAV